MINHSRQWHRWRDAALTALVVALAMGVQAQGTEPESARRELSEIKGRIEALQRSLSERRRQRKSAISRLSESEAKLAQIARGKRRIAATMRRVNTRASKLATREAAIVAKIRREQSGLSRQIRTAYAIGHQDTVKLMLNGERAGDVARLLRYHEFISRKQRATIARLAAARAELAGVKDALARQASELSALEREQAHALDRWGDERDQRAVILKEMDKALGADENQLQRLSRDRKRLEALLRDLETAISDIPSELEPPRSFASLRGKLPWPVRGRKVQRFNDRRGRSGLKWQGVVLAAQPGRDVRAVANARVVFAEWLRGFGLMIILDHGGGFMSLYGHNESLLREPGEWVNAGDPIATVGDTGGVAQPGLYFEIRRNGEPRNPERWCSDRARFRAAL